MKRKGTLRTAITRTRKAKFAYSILGGLTVNYPKPVKRSF